MHPLIRFARLSRLACPVLLAGAGAAVKLRGGALGSELALIVLAGAILGWAIAISFESLAVLLVGAQAEAVSDRGLEELEREKEIVLRSIKELELDAALQKIEERDARELCHPLRQRAVALLHELDRVRADRPGDLEAEIEAELQRRLGLKEPGTEVQG
jgi:hypothetical protein